MYDLPEIERPPYVPESMWGLVQPVASALHYLNQFVPRIPGKTSPYKKIVPHTFLGDVAASTTVGVVVDYPAEAFSNDGRFPFVLTHITAIDDSGGATGLLEITDKDTGYNLLGGTGDFAISLGFFPGQDALSIPDYANNRHFQPPDTFVLGGGYRVETNGGFKVRLQATDTSGAFLALALSGYWILEE